MADGLCVLLGVKTVKIAAMAFTLSWIHSVEKIAWQEDWVIEDGRLRIAEARIKGSGAGMEPPDDAVLKDGWWHYVPKLPPQREVHLAASGATVSAWTLCANGQCLELGKQAGDGITLSACAAGAS